MIPVVGGALLGQNTRHRSHRHWVVAGRAARVPGSRLRGTVGVSVPGTSQEHRGLPLADCENLGHNKSSQMWDWNARAIVFCTYSAAFHLSPGKKKKKLSCKFCSSAAMISTHACGPHCPAPPGRSLALRGVWYSIPWLVSAALLRGLAAQACSVQPSSPQRRQGGTEWSHGSVLFLLCH